MYFVFCPSLTGESCSYPKKRMTRAVSTIWRGCDPCDSPFPGRRCLLIGLVLPCPGRSVGCPAAPASLLPARSPSALPALPSLRREAAGQAIQSRVLCAVAEIPDTDEGGGQLGGTLRTGVRVAPGIAPCRIDIIRPCEVGRRL